MNGMTIGKAAREAGVGVETIRFYERKGLIDQPLRPREGGFRIYPDHAVHRVRFIRKAQELGFSLSEVEDLLALRADPATDSGRVRGRAVAKLAEVNGKIDELARIRAALETLIAACPGGGALRSCSIMEALTDTERTGDVAGGKDGPSK